jgi:hypothetical protein
MSTYLGRCGDNCVTGDVEIFPLRLEAQTNTTLRVCKFCSQLAEAIAAIAEMAPVYQAGRRRASITKYTVLQSFVCEPEDSLQMGDRTRKRMAVFLMMRDAGGLLLNIDRGFRSRSAYPENSKSQHR